MSKKFKKLVKMANIDEGNLLIFRMTCETFNENFRKNATYDNIKSPKIKAPQSF